ncbi:MAG: hypothetical protein M1822_000503 [Bathelium mastoideum]|nr:MAG: hypothetical protein M1822_000503 [Bathelium mastoideum]
MPPHHPLLGHLVIVGGIMGKLPSDVHGHVLPHQIVKSFPDVGPVFYIDTWPFGPPMLVITSSESANQITVNHSLPKFFVLREYMKPMTGGIDLITLEGQPWKTWRNIFQPGFSTSYLMTKVPEMVKDILTYCDTLRERAAKGEMFQMDPLTVNLNLDIIGRLAIDTHFNAQRIKNPFTTALRAQIRWLSFGHEANLFERWHLLRPFAQRWNARKMVLFVSNALDDRYSRSRPEKDLTRKERSRTIVDLALENYLTEHIKSESEDEEMDATFKEAAICQIRTFLFAGHDTSSSTLCYCYHLLSKHPKTRNLVMQEHDNFLGPDVKKAAFKISENPHILNQLNYTLAVIKETLRLYPPASSTRSGEPGYSLILPDGRQCPTDGFLVWSNHVAIHRNPDCWKRPDEFLPERWLVEKDDALFPSVSGAWRSFEFGPRNCIGQQLALLEIKLVLALTVREFHVVSAYEEWDRATKPKGPKTVNEDRAYQILTGAAHPSDGFPCTVTVNG